MLRREERPPRNDDVLFLIYFDHLLSPIIPKSLNEWEFDVAKKALIAATMNTCIHESYGNRRQSFNLTIS